MGNSPEQTQQNYDPFNIHANPQNYQGGHSTPQAHIEKDLEIISSKLDTLKSQLEVMNQRLYRIEKLAENEKPKRKEEDVLNW